MARNVDRAPALDLENLSSKLDWKQFEGFCELAIKSFGYSTIRNYRLKKPRLEIDLIAFRGKIAFAADCKHWKRTVGQSAMLRVAEMQIERCKRVVAVEEFEEIIPIILTLHEESIHLLENGVPLVPIRKIQDFMLNWDAFSERLLVIQK